MQGTVETRCGRVAFEEQGSGTPLLLLHATLHDHHDFDSVMPSLAQHHRVIALDWPGHGTSEVPSSGSVSASLFADVLEDVVDALGLPAVSIIGNSVGGFAAARLAARQPERVSALILVNSGGFVPLNPLTRTFCRAMGTPRIARRVIKAFTRGYMKAQTDRDRRILADVTARARTPTGLAILTQMWRSFADESSDLRSEVGSITASTRVVWGTRDIAIPASAGRTAAQLIPRADLVTLPTGHVVFSSAPAEFLAAAEAVLLPAG